MQEELDRFDNYAVWTLAIRDDKGPIALTWAWAIEMRSGELKASLCLRLFGKKMTRGRN